MQEFFNNVFYKSDIFDIGGIETFLWSIGAKYGDRDIVLIYKTCHDAAQLEKLRTTLRVLKYDPEHRIHCKRAFFLWNADIIDRVDAEEYVMMIHGDYKALGLADSVPNYKQITKYVGVSQQCCDSFREITGRNIEVAYNPLILQKPKKVLKLISAMRRSKEKGKDRMEILARALDEAGIAFQWLVYTDDPEPIPNKNIFWMKPRTDLTDYIAEADYLVQLSNTEGFSYSICEALAVGTPVIVTNFASADEMGIINGVNGWVLPMDMSEIPVAKLTKKLPRFRWKMPEDRWDELLAPGDGTYREELARQKTIRCTTLYFDLEMQRNIFPGAIYHVSEARAEKIIGAGFAELYEEETK